MGMPTSVSFDESVPVRQTNKETTVEYHNTDQRATSLHESVHKRLSPYVAATLGIITTIAYAVAL